MKKLLVILLVVSQMFMEAMAQPEAVYHITYKGQDYKVVELINVKRQQISRWNILRGKRGQEYYVYRLLDLDYPLVMPAADHDMYSDYLRDVPDNRMYENKHPHRLAHQQFCKRWMPVGQFWFGPALTTVQIFTLFF